MSATQFGLGLLLYIAVAVIFYAAGWWQGKQAKTVERDRLEERAAGDRLEERAAGQDQLVGRDQQDQEPRVLVSR